MQRAIPKRPGGRPFLAGTKGDELDALLWHFGGEAVRAAIDATPPDMVPGFLDAVASYLEAGPPVDHEHPDRAERRAALRRRLASLRGQVEAWGDDTPESTFEAIAECENALARLDDEEGAA